MTHFDIIDLPEQYTWWSTKTRARKRNAGWRLDYFFTVTEVIDRVKNAFIMSQVTGSDHCPVGIHFVVKSRREDRMKQPEQAYYQPKLF